MKLEVKVLALRDVTDRKRQESRQQAMSYLGAMTSLILRRRSGRKRELEEICRRELGS